MKLLFYLILADNNNNNFLKLESNSNLICRDINLIKIVFSFLIN